MQLSHAQIKGGFQSRGVQTIVKTLLKKLPIFYVLHARVTPASADFWVARLDEHTYKVEAKALGIQMCYSFSQLWNTIRNYMIGLGSTATLNSETNKSKPLEKRSRVSKVRKVRLADISTTSSLKQRNRRVYPKLQGGRLIYSQTGRRPLQQNSTTRIRGVRRV